MNTLTKIGIAGGLGLLVWGATRAKKAISDFAFDVVGFGTPKLSGTDLTLPLRIAFRNPTSLPINIEAFVADIFLMKNQQWSLAANINQPLSIPSGDTVQTVSAKISLKGIFGGSITDTFTAIASAATTRSIMVKTDVNVKYKGVSLPMQTFQTQITF